MKESKSVGNRDEVESSVNQGRMEATVKDNEIRHRTSDVM